MENFEILFILMFAATLLVGVAQKVHVPYPVMLVLGGILLGFAPGLRPVTIDPHLIFVAILPPILYYGAVGLSFREFKRNWRSIFSLALGLVIFTTLVIGILFKMIFPDFSWALAFAFGAIISPPDAVAAISIFRRFSISPRLLSILEGESIINDASAIVLYRIAVTALLSGSFSLSDGSLEFFQVVLGGVFIGLLLGSIIQRFSERYLDPVVGVVFSFTIPYITYLIADAFGTSGILAVVVCGIVGSSVLRTHRSSLRRVIGYAAWDTFSILINCFVFILIGLQLRTLTGAMSYQQLAFYGFYALLITFAMICIRMIWVYAKSGIAYFKALNSHKATTLCPQILNDAAIIGWSGMRGIVSLAAALALPLTLPDGTPIPGRNEVVLITFLVILITLLIPAFTLSHLIRWLNIEVPSEHSSAHRIRKELAVVAQDKIKHLLKTKVVNEQDAEFLTSYFNVQGRILEVATSRHKKHKNLEAIRLEVLQEQRKHLLEMWERLEIDDRFLNLLEQELDVEETHKSRAEIN